MLEQIANNEGLTGHLIPQKPRAHPDQIAVAQYPQVPGYLQQTYWWAYVHPRALHVFERDWLVNLILFGNYNRLRDAALAALGRPLRGRTLQVACVYGNLTQQLAAALAPDAHLDVIDVLPIQLHNLSTKLPADPRITMLHANSESLPAADASVDQVLLFFLLHEQPEATRRRTLAEALRVVRPGGRVVIVDYHRPAGWNPLRPLMYAVFRTLEPYAHELWRHELAEFLPADVQPAAIDKQAFFGGLYQRLILTR